MPTNENTLVCCVVVPEKRYSMNQWFEAIKNLEGFDGKAHIIFNLFASIYRIGNDSQIIEDHNELREICLAREKDMWLIDSDTIPPPNAFKSLISVDADIISALVPHTKPGFYNTYLIDHDNPDFTTMPLRNANTLANTGIHEIGACGHGCVIIKLAVLQKIEFKSCYKNYSVSKGSDLLFSLEARDLGFKIKVNADVVCDHLR